ncbi:MAG TPA: hypothetical protein VFB50_00245 [Chloroflexota bacterium]|nr:hypothetical protein [Chloroflexota bacterium]
MTAGLPVGRAQLDAEIGQVARDLEQFANQALQLKQYLDATPDATLEAPPFEYAPEDVALLKSAATDMATVANVYKGLVDHTPASDLGVFSRRLMGLYLGG